MTEVMLPNQATNPGGREWQPKLFPYVGIAFVTCLLVSNLAATKLFHIGPAVFTAGVLVFPLSYVFGDVLTELYGYARARRIIWCGLFANLFMSAVLWLAVQLPAAPDWPLKDDFAAIYGFVPRIVAGSVVAYWAGEMTNSLVMSRMKARARGRGFALRAMCSTFAGQLVDSVLFVLICFVGIATTKVLVAAIVSGWAFKVLYEAAALPLTTRFVTFLKRVEGIDHIDYDVDYNPLKM